MSGVAIKIHLTEAATLPLFEELFRSACPKFINPTPPDFDNPEVNIDPVEHHLRIFMDEVKNNMWSPTVKSYLKLYTTMDLKKLAGFLEVEPEKLRCWLLVNKQRSRQVRWSEGGLLDGDRQSPESAPVKHRVLHRLTRCNLLRRNHHHHHHGKILFCMTNVSKLLTTKSMYLRCADYLRCGG